MRRSNLTLTLTTTSFHSAPWSPLEEREQDNPLLKKRYPGRKSGYFALLIVTLKGDLLETFSIQEY
jgi:hypothetical protein